MSSSSKYKQQQDIEVVDEHHHHSMSSFETSPVSDSSISSPSSKSSSGFDFSELIRPSANRTVISYSAHSQTLVERTNSITDENRLLELHRAVFQNDVAKLRNLLVKLSRSGFKNVRQMLDMKDKFENTPLHLACMLGNLEMVKMLADAGATVKIRNAQMWTPLNEAISFGNRDLIRITLKKYEKEVETIMNEAKPRIVQALHEMNDFYVEINWDFESWIPFVSRFLPSDTCKLYKKGTKLRLDCTIGDLPTKRDSANKESAANSVGASISPLSWSRGDLSVLFEIEKFGTKDSIIFMDNTKKVFIVIDKHEQVEQDLEKEIDLFLAKEMVFIKLNTNTATFLPTQIGWFNKKDKVETLNGYMCNFYDVNNLFMQTKLRGEHLSDEELKKMEDKQAKMKKQFSSGGGALMAAESSEEKSRDHGNDPTDQDVQGLDDLMEDIEYRPSLPSPPPTHLSWDEYISSASSHPPCIGRKQKIKESRKEFKAQIAMSQEFPMTVLELDKLLDALAPLAKFRKLKEFLKVRLPPGFPVKIDIPIVPAISAKVCFKNFVKGARHEDSLFRVPDDYREETFE